MKNSEENLNFLQYFSHQPIGSRVALLFFNFSLCKKAVSKNKIIKTDFINVVANNYL
jgi:hypothetical protein